MELINLTSNIEFNQKLINESERDYSQLKLAPNQRALIEQAAKLYTQYFNISEMAMRGFIARAIKQWQIDNKKVLDDIYSSSGEEQVKMTRELANVLKTVLVKIIIKPEQVPLLEQVIDEAVEMALKSF